MVITEPIRKVTCPKHGQPINAEIHVGTTDQTNYSGSHTFNVYADGELIGTIYSHTYTPKKPGTNIRLKSRQMWTANAGGGWGHASDEYRWNAIRNLHAWHLAMNKPLPAK